MIRFPLLLLLALTLFGCSRNGVTEDDVFLFAELLQGKSPEDVRTAIEHRFGPPARDIGSGLRIDQWDVADGILTYHPLQGPFFTKHQTVTRLLRTNNPVAECLFGDYEMTTPPDRTNHGRRFWIGNLTITPGGNYLFKDSGTNLSHRIEQEDNFLMNHPAGIASVEYASDINEQTLLENVPDRERVATISFRSSNGMSSETYNIVTSRTAMTLSFARDDGISFDMYKGWINYWY